MQSTSWYSRNLGVTMDRSLTMSKHVSNASVLVFIFFYGTGTPVCKWARPPPPFFVFSTLSLVPMPCGILHMNKNKTMKLPQKLLNMKKKKNFEATSETFGLLSKCAYYMTLDPRSPFPDSVWGIIPGPATTQKVYQGIEWFSQLAGLQLQWLTVLSMLIRGITAAGGWHILLSCYVTLFWLRVKFDKFPSCE